MPPDDDALDSGAVLCPNAAPASGIQPFQTAMPSKIFKPVSFAILALVVAGAVLLEEYNRVSQDGSVMSIHDFPSAGLRVLAKKNSGLISLEVWHGEREIGIMDTEASAYSSYSVSVDKSGDVVLDSGDVGVLLFERAPDSADDRPLRSRFRKKAVPAGDSAKPAGDVR